MQKCCYTVIYTHFTKVTFFSNCSAFKSAVADLAASDRKSRVSGASSTCSPLPVVTWVYFLLEVMTESKQTGASSASPQSLSGTASPRARCAACAPAGGKAPPCHRGVCLVKSCEVHLRTLWGCVCAPGTALAGAALVFQQFPAPDGAPEELRRDFLCGAGMTGQGA